MPDVWISNGFTPFAALIGGALIGLSAVLLMWLNGRIAGVSGILQGTLARVPDGRGWRIAFLLGLIGGAAVWFGIHGWPAPSAPTTAPWMLIVAGLLVGAGTRLGSGCTSGHGICGLARRSPRSIVAVLIFMSAGFATVGVIRHVLTP
jgi:uncharacterized membrane protein YedE/YeeE